MEPLEDNQLARLYDYTKFHIGIYLSFAGGVAALLGSEKTGWFLSTLIAENRKELLAALVLMALAGMCAGVVATSTIESRTFDDFWNKPQAPQTLSVLSLHGRIWAMLEHLFFWASLLILGYTIAIGFSKADANASQKLEPGAAVPCCCTQAVPKPGNTPG